jgi:hypothetical protein
MHRTRRRDPGRDLRRRLTRPPLLLACAVLLACKAMLPAPAAAQSADASLTVSVQVVDGLSVFRERALNFGDAVAGSGVRTVMATDANAGLFRIHGRRNRWVDVVLSPPTQLVNGSHQVPYAWQAAKNEAVNDPAGAVAVPALTDRVRLRDFSAPGSDGMAWIWVFGSVDLGGVAAALPAGTYTGVFTISVAY